MKLEHREFLKSEEGRKFYIEEIINRLPKDDNWQNFHTPYDLCEKMISKTTLDGKSILVLFNVEFLEVLIHKFGVLSKNIMFLADCQIESEIATKVYKVNNVIVNNIDDIEKELKKLKTFDLCFSNPPYSYPLEMKIVELMIKFCNEMVVIYPGGWILDNKGINNLWKTHKENLTNKIKSIEFVNGNYIFGIKKFCWCNIIHVTNIENIEKISLIYPYDNTEVDNFDDITIFKKEWFSIVKPFIDIVTNKCFSNKLDNIRSHQITDPQKINKDKYNCQISNIRGNILINNSEKIYKDDFFTMLPKNINDCKGVRKSKTDALHIFMFDTEVEVTNFLNYLTTDFVRFCLSIYKIDQTNCPNEWILIPWLDFKETWNDDKLFSYFDIGNETRKYIESFLPDYYGIRSDS